MNKIIKGLLVVFYIVAMVLLVTYRDNKDVFGVVAILLIWPGAVYNSWNNYRSDKITRTQWRITAVTALILTILLVVTHFVLIGGVRWGI